MGWVRTTLAGFSVALLPAAALPAAAHAADESAQPAAVAFPSPGDRFAAPQTVLTLREVDPAQVDSITVTGSASGRHKGTTTALPRGLGLTFDPATDFQPGEQVTVRVDGARVRSGEGGTYSFTVARPAAQRAGETLHPPMPDGGKQAQSSPSAQTPRATPCEPSEHHFVSRPDLGAVPGACVQTPANNTGSGKIFLGYQSGPVMLDNNGDVVWYRPPTTPNTTNFRVVRYRGERMLSYYQGYFVPHGGQGQTRFVLLNDHYQQVATVHAANGYLVDEHEFTVTPRGTAYIGSYVPVVVDLSPYGGRPGTTVYDYVVQEIDIATNRLLFEWHALDHIPITESQVPPPQGDGRYDWFHGNAIEVANDGNLLISSRHTSTIYKVNRLTEEVMWKLGGENSTFADLRTARDVASGEAYWFCWQHDIRQLADGTYTLYDNGGGPGDRCGPSRGLHVKLDPATGTATILDVYRHDPDVRNTYMGAMQTLSNGNELVGWGNIPRVTEYHPDGSVALDLKLTDMSYRAFRFEWEGHPTQPPAVAWRDDGDGSVSIYASWNGATEATSWRLLAGDSYSTLHEVGPPQPKMGFETALSLAQPAPAVRVQALSADGTVLGTSPVIYWSAETGAHQVRDPIAERYRDFGTSSGKLGYPTTDTSPTPDGVGKYNHFSGSGGSSIYWSPQSGAHEIQGAIHDKWESLSWERGVLGYPTTDETTTPDGIGRFNHFNGSGGASVYWTPATGAHEVHGAIHDEWAESGWEQGVLGYPTTDESTTPDGIGRYNHFNGSGGSSIYWTPSTGAHHVLGAIHDKWASLGWERSRLGYPVSDEYTVPGGRRSDFQHGSIVWDSSTGAVRVYYG